MGQRIVIVGAGYTGLHFAKLAVDAGWEVVGTSRKASQRVALTDAGAQAVDWSALDDLSPLRIDEETTVVYSIPPIAEQFLRHLQPFLTCDCARLIYLSSASSYGDHRGADVDEDSDRRPTSPAGVMRKLAEDAVLTSQGNRNVVRVVGIYGPGRTLDRYIASGRYKLVDGGQKLTNRIHVDDLATVLLALIMRAPDGRRAYIASDGNPMRVAELVDWLVEHRGINPPEQVSLEQYRAQRGDDAADRWRNSYRASNHRMAEELGVKPRYRTVLHGYRAIFAERAFVDRLGAPD